MASPVADGSVLGALALAAALGLRHSTDPDHLVAVSTLIAGRRRDGARAAARLGAAWGGGHALTLLLFGLPIVLVQAYLPERVQQLAEGAIGVLIVGLAVRLLVRYRRGAFHAHAHEHDDGVAHIHLHSHAGGPAHGHDHPRPRSAFAAFLIGCLHGTGGSAAVSILLVASVPGREAAVAALAIFAAGTAVSMALLSAAFGRLLGAAPVRERFRAAIPAMGSFGMAFGVWYALSAYDVVPGLV
jgi:cytochrome c biogenesis protein CcdA